MRYPLGNFRMMSIRFNGNYRDYRGYIGSYRDYRVILGYFRMLSIPNRDNGKEHENYYNGLYRVHIGVRI